jgi:SCP-2 sterol transfer family
MASLEECRTALDEFAASLSGADEKAKRAMAERTLSCYITDLDVTFTGRLDDGRLVDVEEKPGRVPGDQTQVRLSMTSDDLVAMTNGKISFVQAWLTGRVKIDASFRDLLRLRSLL